MKFFSPKKGPSFQGGVVCRWGGAEVLRLHSHTETITFEPSSKFARRTTILLNVLICQEDGNGQTGGFEDTPTLKSLTFGPKILECVV